MIVPENVPFETPAVSGTHLVLRVHFETSILPFNLLNMDLYECAFVETWNGCMSRLTSLS
jgi:hypothetical protein